MFNVNVNSTQDFPMETSDMLADWLPSVQRDPSLIYVDTEGTSIQMWIGVPRYGVTVLQYKGTDRYSQAYYDRDAVEADFLARVRGAFPGC